MNRSRHIDLLIFPLAFPLYLLVKAFLVEPLWRPLGWWEGLALFSFFAVMAYVLGERVKRKIDPNWRKHR